MSKITVGVKIVSDFFGVDARTIRRWVQKGMPRVDSGVYSPRDCFLWWEEYINSSSTGDDENKDVKERYWAAKAENEELKRDKTKGRLVLKEEVEKEFGERAADLKISLRSLQFRLPAVLEGKSREEISQEIKKEHDRALMNYCRAGKFVSDCVDKVSDKEPVSKKAVKKTSSKRGGSK